VKIHVIMWHCSNIPVRRFAVRCVVTRCYSHSDVPSCWLHNPSPITGNQLDHSLLSRGRSHVRITAHLTVSNTSVDYSIRCPEFMLTIIETASWRTTPKWWINGEKNGPQVTMMPAASRRQPQGFQQWILWSIQLSDAELLKQMNVLSN